MSFVPEKELYFGRYGYHYELAEIGVLSVPGCTPQTLYRYRRTTWHEHGVLVFDDRGVVVAKSDVSLYTTHTLQNPLKSKLPKDIQKYLKQNPNADLSEYYVVSEHESLPNASK